MGDNQPWFDFCVLADEKGLLGEVLQERLGLKDICSEIDRESQPKRRSDDTDLTND